jgi:prevent-host-death family protein
VDIARYSKQKEAVETRSFTATEAKNEFGRMLEKAIRGETVVITKHDAPKAVLISMEQFNALKHAPGLKLDTLSGEFDTMLAQMQTPKASAGMNAAFRATPHQLGKAAVAAARKRD